MEDVGIADRSAIKAAGALSLTLLFVLVASVMVGLGQAVERTFVRYQPLNAYRLHILGSMAGIVAFSVLSFLNQPPAAWDRSLASA
jgi:hypothetical protein